MIFVDKNDDDMTQVLICGDVTLIEVIDNLNKIKEKPLIVYAETSELDLELVRKLPVVNKAFPANIVKVAILIHQFVTSGKSMKVMNLYSSYINKAEIKIFDSENEARYWLASPPMKVVSSEDGFNRFFCMTN